MDSDRIRDHSAITRLIVLLLLLLVFIGLPVSALLWMTSVPGRSHVGPLPPLSPAQEALAGRLQTHVRTIARTPHNLNFPRELEEAARYIEGALHAMGHPVRRQPFAAGGQTFRNIEVVIEPARPGAATLVIGAHYDSAGNAPGANDNATGVAAVIELARALADLRGRAPCRIRLALFVNEEPPFFQTEQMGSLVYARRLKTSGEKVAAMMSLETLGFYSDRPHSQHYPWPMGALYPDRGNFVAFVGTMSSRGLVRSAVRSFRSHAAFPSEGGVAPSFIRGVDWSDHWSFAKVGVPALMVTDTAPFRYPHYHSSWDRPDKVDYRRLARVVSGLEPLVRRCDIAP